MDEAASNVVRYLRGEDYPSSVGNSQSYSGDPIVDYSLGLSVDALLAFGSRWPRRRLQKGGARSRLGPGVDFGQGPRRRLGDLLAVSKFKKTISR